MNNFKINLIEDLDEKEKISFRKEFKRSSFLRRNKKTIIKLIAVLVLVNILLFSRGVLTEESLIKEIPKISFWKGVAKVLIFHESLLRGEISDRINILFLGMGGSEHEGPYLTDSIILVSFKPSSNQLALFSLPRDLWVPIPGYGWQKINAANALGEAKEKDGCQLASLVVSEILDLPIHYFFRIDFNGFKEIINTLGGIEIYVEKSFTDSLYPGKNFTYRTISFEKGWQVMNGERALEFVRSRHGTNGEDSDFARMKRQQKVIFAIKEKIQKIKIIEEPKKAWILFNLLGKYFKTNLNFDEMIKLGKLLKNVQEDKIIKKTIEINDNSPIYAEIYNGAYILKTKTGDFKELAKMAKDIFNKNDGFKEQTSLEKPKIIILNGTFITGLANSKAENLSYDFEITEIGNAEKRGYQETVIYDLTGGTKNNYLETLKKRLAGKVIKEIPLNFQEKNVDFVVILGEK